MTSPGWCIAAGLSAWLVPVSVPIPGPTAAGGGGEAFYVDTSLDLDGELLSWHLRDVEGDEREELVVAVRKPSGERELSVYRVLDTGLDLEPRHRIPILADVLAWSSADVREEPGRELILLTRGGAWSYSLTLDGYRGNVRKLVEMDLVYDVSDPSSLPFYGYVLPGPARARDSILLPGRATYAVWGSPESSAEDATYRKIAEFAADFSDVSQERERANGDEDQDGDRDQRRGGAVEFQLGGNGGATPFVGEDLERESTLLADARHYRAPALVDLDGAGELDLVVRSATQLAVHLGSAGTVPAEPTRVEDLPESLRDSSTTLRLVDLDGDRDLDLLAHVFDEPDGFENGRHQLLLYTNDGSRLVSEEPSHVLRFEAALLIVQVADVDGDGLPDLALRKLELPSLMGAVTGLEFTFSHLVYLREKGGLARKPALKDETVYDEESIVDVVANRELRLDCDGDGIADLVEIDVNGTVVIRRLQRKKSFLGGVSWSLEAGPWKRFDAGGSIESLSVEDVNGDGLGDVFSASRERLTILFSRAAGGGR